jgi:hypothetical protein
MSKLVPFDLEAIDMWREHGIPADPSTLEHALQVIIRLQADLDEMYRIVDQLDAHA